MRLINLIIVHASASSNPGQDSIEAIRDFHTAPTTKEYLWGKYPTFGKGFSDVGYQYYIDRKSGQVFEGRPLELAGAHCEGHNKNSIGICLGGDGDFTDSQLVSLKELIKKLLIRFNLTLLDVLPHKAFNKNKTCPNFDLAEFLKNFYS